MSRRRGGSRERTSAGLSGRGWVVDVLRNLATALIAFILFFGSAEVLVRSLWQPSESLDTEYVNELDPQKRKVRLPVNAGGLGWAVEYSMTQIPVLFNDPEFIFRVRPDAEGAEDYRGINSLGFRGKEFDLGPRRNREQRIITLGDSCTFGWNIKVQEETWPWKVAAKVTEKFAIPSVTYNLGQPGYSTTQGRMVFESWFDRIDPDVVVLYFGWNDVRESPLLTDAQTIQALKVVNSTWVTVLRSLRFYLLFEHWVSGVFKARVARSREGRGGASGFVRVPLPEMIGNLEAMYRKSTQAGAKVVIILPPWAQAAPWVGKLHNDEIKKVFEGRAAMPALAKIQHTSPGAADYYVEDFYHPNQRGSEYIAEELASEIGAYRKAK